MKDLTYFRISLLKDLNYTSFDRNRALTHPSQFTRFYSTTCPLVGGLLTNLQYYRSRRHFWTGRYSRRVVYLLHIYGVNPPEYYYG